MLSAILLAATIQLPPGPMLPPGANPDVHRAFNVVEAELSVGRFDAAKAKAALLPRYNITFSWDDKNIPPASRPEYINARNEAFKTLTSRVPGLTIKPDAKPAIKFTFGDSLATDPTSGLPRGIALFFSENPAEPRLEAVIGLNRGNPLERTNFDSIHNEVLFAIGSYLGMTTSPYLGTIMGRSDLQMQYRSNPEAGELGAFRVINEATLKIQSAIAKKEKLAPAKPKASFSPTVIERGPVIQGTPIQFSVQVNNHGNAPLSFRVVPDCGCVTAMMVAPIQPGSSAAVPIRVDTTDINGELNKHLILISNDIDQPIQRFPINIKTTPRYRFLSTNPSVLIVDEAGLDSDVFLVSPPERPIEISSVEVSGNPGSATFEPWKGNLADPELNEPSKPRSGYKIKLRLESPPVSGRSAAMLVVKTTDPKYPTIRYTVFAQKGIAVMPASVFFGDMGKAVREASFMVNRPNKPFKILKIESDSSFVDATATAINGETEYKVTCRYNGKAPLGDFRSTLTIHTDAPKQPKIRVGVMGIVK